MAVKNGNMSTAPSFYGIFVAIATPFKEHRIDEDAFYRHLTFLVQKGVSGVVPCGTTGESVALSLEERQRLIQICLEVCGQKARVIPGTGAPTLDKALLYTRQAQDLGAHGALVVTPYYVKADQSGVQAYYEALHAQTHIPLILYNNPGRTGWELPTALVEQLSHQAPRICGLKDASSDLSRPVRLRTALGFSFSLLSGEDPTCGAFWAQGGDGVISVGANLVPHLYRAFYEAFQKADLKIFAELRDQLFQLSTLLFQTPSPGPLKYALSLMGYGSDVTRLPLSPLSASHRQALEAFLKKWEIIT